MPRALSNQWRNVAINVPGVPRNRVTRDMSWVECFKELMAGSWISVFQNNNEGFCTWLKGTFTTDWQRRADNIRPTMAMGKDGAVH